MKLNFPQKSERGFHNNIEPNYMTINQKLPYQDLLYSIAYNFLGSVSEAEDMVQDVWLVWLEKGGNSIKNPRAYLCKTMTNKCIDRLKVLDKERSNYKGIWLPEPFVHHYREALDFEPLSQSLMLLLEKLNPLERAVYLLREVFDFSFEDIRSIIDKTEDNCRQILRRARTKIQGRKRYKASSEQIEEITQRFSQAAEKGSFQPLIEMLQKDAILYSDGGGKVAAALNPLKGANIIGQFLYGISRFTPENLTTKTCMVNGNPGIIGFSDNLPFTTFSIEMDESGQIVKVFITRNPDKMNHLKINHSN